MAEFASKLIRKENIADGIMAFYFEKPEGFMYIPGQHATLKLVHPVLPDGEGDSRTFSFVTIPSENEVGFTTRMRGTGFKTDLQNAQPGLEVMLINPRGTMVLPTDTSRSLVILAGGIGITPFIGMVKQATQQNSPQKIYLFHANKTQAEVPFLSNLKELAAKNSNFTYIPTLTQEEWDGEKGRVSKEMIEKYIGDFKDKIFYLAGPAGMVNGMMEILPAAGVDPLFIKSEDFGEYK